MSKVTVASARLGYALRELRRAAGISGLELSRRTKISQSKVSRVENGQQLPTVDDVDRWLEACGVADPDQRSELVTLLGNAAAARAVPDAPRVELLPYPQPGMVVAVAVLHASTAANATDAADAISTLLGRILGELHAEGHGAGGNGAAPSDRLSSPGSD